MKGESAGRITRTGLDSEVRRPSPRAKGGSPWNPTPVLVAVLVGVAFVGCATASRQVWTKAGASREDLARDRYTCIQESRVPYSMSHGAASATSTSAGAAWGSRASIAQGGGTGGFVLFGATRRAESEANRLFDACMEARGWE